MTPDELKSIARRFVHEVFNRRNLACADEVLADDIVELSAPPPDIPADKAGAIERIKRFLDASEDLRAEVLDVVTDGRRVAIRARYVGTDTGGIFPGAPATGRTFDIEGIDVAVANDEGKFVQHYAITDMRAAMDQLGLVSGAAHPE